MTQIKNNSDTVIVQCMKSTGSIHTLQEFATDWQKQMLTCCVRTCLEVGRSPFTTVKRRLPIAILCRNRVCCGAQKQIEALAHSVQGRYRYCFIVGYSIGATIAWLCSGKADLFSGVVGVYGSRLRDYKAVESKCPVLLCFPRTEESFDVAELLQALFGKSNV